MFFRKKTNQWALAGILLAVIFSKTNPIFTKTLLAQGWTPTSLYFMTLLIMTIFLAVHEFMALEFGGRPEMDCRDIKGTILTAITGGILSPLLFFNGLLYVSASEAVLITSLLPLFIVLLAVLMLGEHFNRSLLMGGAFLLAGFGVLLWQDVLQVQMSIGVPMMLLASFCSALTTTFHKKYVKHRHLDSIVFVRSLISLVAVGAWLIFTEPESFALLSQPQNIWLVLGLAIISFLLPFFLYFRSLKKLKTMEAGFVVALGPGVGVLMANVFLGEQITQTQLLSLILIIFGVLFINVPLTKIKIMPSRLMETGPLRK